MKKGRDRNIIQAACLAAVGHRYMPAEFIQFCLEHPTRQVSDLLDDRLPQAVIATDPDFSDADMLEMFEERRDDHPPGYQMPSTRIPLRATTWRELGKALTAVPFDQYDLAFGLLTAGVQLSGNKVVIEFCT